MRPRRTKRKGLFRVFPAKNVGPGSTVGSSKFRLSFQLVTASVFQSFKIPLRKGQIIHPSLPLWEASPQLNPGESGPLRAGRRVAAAFVDDGFINLFDPQGGRVKRYHAHRP